MIVDNQSTDGGVELALSVRPDAVVARSENRGFGAGCNLGAQNSSGDVLLFLNPDAMLGSGALESLAERALESPSPIVGPELQSADGSVLHVVRRRRTIPMEIGSAIPGLQRFLPDSAKRDIPSEDPVYSEGGEVSYLQGACMAIDRGVFDRLGGFDERFFLYFEEEDLCLRAKQIGSPSVYEPAAKVTHLWGTSIGKVSGLSFHHLGRSRVIFYRKWFSAPAAVVATAAVTIGGALTLLEVWLRLRFRPTDTLRARFESHRAHLRGIRSGITVGQGG